MPRATDAERAAVQRITEGVERHDVLDVLRGASALFAAMAGPTSETSEHLADELLTPEQAAEILNCERAWLMRNHHRYASAVVKLGRLVRFSRRGLAACMAREGL